MSNDTDSFQRKYDFAIYILSFDRFEQLSTTIRFYLQFGFQVRVVYDSKDELDITHENLRSLRLKAGFGQRALALSKMIDTDFAILAPDDDIFVPSSLIKMSNFLRNSEYTSVSGQALGVWTNKTILEICPAYSHFEFEDTFGMDRANRLESQISDININPISMYKMMSGANLKLMLKLFEKIKDFSTPNIYEISAEILILSIGHTRRLNEIYWLRNWNQPSISNSHWERKTNFAKWWLDEKFIHEKRDWLALVNNICPELSIEFLTQMLDTRITLNTEIRRHIFKDFYARFFRFVKDWLRHHIFQYYKWNKMLTRLNWYYEETEILNCLKSIKSL